MIFSATAVMVNQLNCKDVDAISHTCDILRDFVKHYGEEATLQSPNTGEIIQTVEIPRVLGILDFLLANRVVEVNPH